MPINLVLSRFLLEFSDAAARAGADFTGSAWRGAFGHRLRHLACVTGRPSCDGCPMLHDCAYSEIFATPIPPTTSVMTRYNEAPHPYIFREEPMHSGGQRRLHVTLIGRAARHRDLVLRAVVRAANGEQGIHGRKLAFLRLWQWNEDEHHWQDQGSGLNHLPPALAAQCPQIPPCPEGEIEVHLHTPLRLRHQGKHVRANSFNFADLYTHALRRVSLLSVFHTDTPLQAEFRDLSQAARNVAIHDVALRWQELERYSTRQATDMRLGGLLGHFKPHAETLKPFWPILWMGQFTHAGRATTMGLGYYTLHAASLPDILRTLSSGTMIPLQNHA